MKITYTTPELTVVELSAESFVAASNGINGNLEDFGHDEFLF